MGEIQGRLLIGGMVLRNLEASLDEGSLDSEFGWTGSLLIDPPLQECLQLHRPCRLELDDERAGQIESRTSTACRARASCEFTFEDALR